MEKVWLQNYQKGVPEHIEVNYKSLVDLIEQSLTKFSSLPAYTCMGKTLTFKEVDDMSQKIGAYFLGQLKLKKGDRVAIMMPNILQYPAVLYGILRAGLVVVNVNPLYTPRELEHQLQDSGAKAIVIVENFAHVLEHAISKTKIEHIITTRFSELLSFPKDILINFVLKYVKKMVPTFHLPHAVSFKKALEIGSRISFQPEKTTLEDIAFLQYTGGTTGVSKGAMLTHSNMVSNILQASAWIQMDVREGKELIVTALPLYHIFSLTANCMTFLRIGGHNLLIPNPRDVAGFIKELKRYPFTAITGVNTLFNALIHHLDFATVDFSHMRLTLGGGMAVQKAVAEKWKKATGSTLSQAYGLTETSPAVCMNPLNLEEFNGSIGLPVPSTQVGIFDDDHKEVPLGEAGELCVKGPQVMKGYWQRPEETAKSFSSDGWLKTGDIAVMNAQGYFTIVDRKKDMIIVSGFNVYPNEIEEVVAAHPGVLEVAAIGIPHEKSGEVVKVYVVKKDENLTEADVIAYCRQSLTGYKVPKAVEFRKELPKTNVGKILRRALKETPLA